MLASAVILLTACGGGGGQAIPASAQATSLTLDKSAISFEAFEGEAIVGQNVNATLSPPSVDAYGEVSTDRNDLVDLNFSVLTQTIALVGVTPKAGLPVGIYTGIVNVRACADSACLKVLATASFKFELKVKTIFKASPKELVFTAAAGATGIAPQSVILTFPDVPTPGSVQPFYGNLYLQGSPAQVLGGNVFTNSVSKTELAVTISPVAGLSAGTYQGKVVLDYRYGIAGFMQTNVLITLIVQ